MPPEQLQTPCTESALAVQTLSEALDTMAFIATEPAGQSPPPERPLVISMGFAGPRRGELHIVAGESFGVMLAANVLGTDPADPDAIVRGHDALQELVNVTVGALMPRLAASPEDAFVLSIPRWVRLEAPGAWEAFLARPGAQALNCDGHALAVVLELNGAGTLEG